MTQEKFKQASKIQDEIDRLDMLIKQLENKDTLNANFSDYAYLINLLGKKAVHYFMIKRKRILEKKFEEL